MRIRSFEDGSDDELGFEDGRDILEGVNDEVDLMGGESSFEFGGPESFGLEEVESLGSVSKEKKEEGRRKGQRGLKGGGRKVSSEGPRRAG